MPDTKVSELTSATPVATDELLLVDDPGGAPSSKRATVQSVLDLLTDGDIKTAYENNADTNAFTDADHSKLDGIEAGADVTDATNVEAAIEGITLTAVSGATGDEVLVVDATDGGLKSVLWENLPGSGGGISNVVEDATPQLGGDLDTQGNAITGGLVLDESADHAVTPTAGSAEIWVSNDATQKLMFTDDAGTDKEVLTDASGTTLSTKATPVGADEALIFDSADSENPKTSTLTQIGSAMGWGAGEANTVDSDPTGVTGADQITNMMSLTQAEYDAIGTPNASTLYFITS
jgi:hypothetical protein